MKHSGNCTGIMSDGKYHRCPFYRNPTYHSGFTGKTGPETWHYCKYNRDYPSQLKSCDLAGMPEKQKDFWTAFVRTNDDDRASGYREE